MNQSMGDGQMYGGGDDQQVLSQHHESILRDLRSRAGIGSTSPMLDADIFYKGEILGADPIEDLDGVARYASARWDMWRKEWLRAMDCRDYPTAIAARERQLEMSVLVGVLAKQGHAV